VTIVLLRHASAGSRELWQDDDRLRPLDETGRRQAEEIAGAFDDHGLARIVSSPCRRCRETVAPLAARLSLPVELREEVADNASPEQAVALLRELDAGATLVCTHREVIGPLVGQDRACPMGAAWTLEPVGGRLVPTEYVPPP
jgi:8-oxo-dGTP diphosphatase